MDGTWNVPTTLTFVGYVYNWLDKILIETSTTGAGNAQVLLCRRIEPLELNLNLETCSPSGHSTLASESPVKNLFDPL